MPPSCGKLEFNGWLRVPAIAPSYFPPQDEHLTNTYLWLSHLAPLTGITQKKKKIYCIL